jgi:hypothetical protein
MTERRSDPGFTVAPRRLGEGPGGRGPGRRRWVGIAAVLVAATAIVVIAVLGPRLADRPNLDLAFFATPTPLTTPSPVPSSDPTPLSTPGVTPLPEITRPDGVGLAAGKVALAADGFRVLDVGSGALDSGIQVNQGRDALVRAPDGTGWTCVCFVDDESDQGPIRHVQVAALDEKGTVLGGDEIATLPVIFDSERGSDSPTTDVDIRTDGRHGLLAVANRIGDTWQFDLSAVDVVGRHAGPTVKLGVASIPGARPGPKPSPSPANPVSPGPDETFVPSPDVTTSFSLDGPHVRIAPEGRVAIVWGIVQESREVVIAAAVRAWRIELDEEGRIGPATPIAGLADLPAFCSSIAFAAPDRLAWLCPEFPSDPNEILASWQVGAIDLDGRLRGSKQLPATDDGYFGEPLFDRANGQMYAWDAFNLTLTRFDVRTLDATSVRFDPAAGSAPGIAAVGGVPPVWRDSDSAVQMFSYSQIAGSPDGSRVYLVGFDRNSVSETGYQRSLGIFVVDRATLALLDRWAPAANYLGISVMGNGQVLAAGLPGADADGREAPWQGSLTVHDPSDGRILVRFGQLGQDAPPLVFDR